MVCVTSIWVPHMLISDQMWICVESTSNFLGLIVEDLTYVNRVVVCDETRLHHYNLLTKWEISVGRGKINHGRKMSDSRSRQARSCKSCSELLNFFMVSSNCSSKFYNFYKFYRTTFRDTSWNFPKKFSKFYKILLEIFLESIAEIFSKFFLMILVIFRYNSQNFRAYFSKYCEIILENYPQKYLLLIFRFFFFEFFQNFSKIWVILLKTSRSIYRSFLKFVSKFSEIIFKIFQNNPLTSQNVPK